MAYISGKIFPTTLQFRILKVKFSVAEFVIRQFLKNKFLFKFTIEGDLLISKIGNHRVAKDISPQKISHDL